MKMPWNDRTGLAKAAAFFATLLLVSMGLCGVNFFVVLRFVPLSGGAPPPAASTWPTTLLSATGTIELIGIGVGLAGLIVVAVGSAVKVFRKHDADESDDE